MSDIGRIQLNSATVQEAKNTASAVNAQERQSPSISTSVKVGGTTNRVTYTNGKMTASAETAVARNTNAPIPQTGTASRSDTSSVVSGKSSVGGRSISGDELQRDSVVSVGGMQSTVAGLAAAGFIAKNPNGVYEWTTKGRAAGGGGNEPQQAHSAATDHATPADQQQQQQQEQQPTYETPKLDNAGEALLQEFNEKLPAHEFQAAVRGVIASNGQLSPEAIDLAAKRLGISQEEAATKADALRASFQAQADAAIGPHAQAVYAYGWQQSPEEMRTLVNEFVNYGKTEGLKALADRYMQNLDTIDPAAILNSDDGRKMNARQEPNGRISIETPKGRMLWSAWVRIANTKPHFK